MSYAVKNDGLGFRAVNGPDDCGPDETYSETLPDISKAQKWEAYRILAQVALDKTSVTVERVIEGVALGTLELTNPDVVTFMRYRQALRAILKQNMPKTIPVDLPTVPDYPQGT